MGSVVFILGASSEHETWAVFNVIFVSKLITNFKEILPHEKKVARLVILSMVKVTDVEVFCVHNLVFTFTIVEKKASTLKAVVIVVNSDLFIAFLVGVLATELHEATSLILKI